MVQSIIIKTIKKKVFPTKQNLKVAHIHTKKGRKGREKEKKNIQKVTYNTGQTDKFYLF